MKKTKKLNSENYKNNKPNEQHRAERWSGARVHRNKKVYNRKEKHKKRYNEIWQSSSIYVIIYLRDSVGGLIWKKSRRVP